MEAACKKSRIVWTAGRAQRVPSNQPGAKNCYTVKRYCSRVRKISYVDTSEAEEANARAGRDSRRTITLSDQSK